MAQTENQAKAADLLRMLQESGVATLAGELQEIIAEAYEEGLLKGQSQEPGPKFPEDEVNPYEELIR